MSNTGNSKPKQKKSKSKLDRLLLIKKNIMDSLSMLSRNYRSAAQVARNNTVPKEAGRGRSRTLQRTERPGVTDLPDCDTTPRPACNAHLHTDQIRKPPFGHYQPSANLTASVNAQCVLQSTYQTWPYDVYFERPFQDEYSFQPANHGGVNPFHRQCENHLSELHSKRGHAGREQQITPCSQTQWSAYNDPKGRSMRHQEIQTDSIPVNCHNMCDVNADIVRYLNQFNDKVAFDMHAPTHIRESGGFLPVYGECSDRFWYSHQVHPDRPPIRWVPRKSRDHISPNRRDFYANYPPYPTSATKTYFPQGSEKTRPAVNERPHYLVPPYQSLRASSDDSAGSIFSSETDSDFVFYPCTSLTHSFHCMTLVDSKARDSSFLSPPLDMPENVNTNFSWRSDFCGSSLDDVTLQFFLDEDALSDDVFMDDPVSHYSPKMKSNSENKLSPGQHRSPSGESSCKKRNEVLYQRHNVPSLCEVNHLGFKESYGDNCYAYRYADIDEVLDNYKVSPREAKSQNSPGKAANSPSPVNTTTDDVHATDDVEILCDYDDTPIELSHEFANVFDSLRRSSTQSKARKMWRQRRARNKKNAANVSLSEDTAQPTQKSSACQPTIFTFDHVYMPTKVTQPSPPQKPLRGILKNKECKSPIRTENEQCHHRPTGSASPFTDDAPQQHVSPCIIISDADQVTKKLEDTSAHQTPKCDLQDSNTLCHEQATSSPKLAIVKPTVNEESSGDPVAAASLISERASLSQSGQDADGSQVKDKEIKSTSPRATEQFHFILSPTDGEHGQVIAVRKNSLEIHRWTQSLQRRHRKLARKTGGRTNRYPNGLKTSDNDDPAKKASPATI